MQSGPCAQGNAGTQVTFPKQTMIDQTKKLMQLTNCTSIACLRTIPPNLVIFHDFIPFFLPSHQRWCRHLTLSVLVMLVFSFDHTRISIISDGSTVRRALGTFHRWLVDP
jgi:hypothetical protein